MSRLVYVIQKHKASRLHYDFRLQVGDALASWAIPKGPSLSPKDKRLAVQVDDHSLEYANFEGKISEGSYGAGTVIVWDNGYWETSDKRDPKEHLKNGKLKMVIYGKKLMGGWVLLKMKSAENNWLLIKERDDFSDDNAEVVANKPESVISEKLIEDVEKDKEAKIINCDIG